MKWIKETISFSDRIRWLRGGIDWLRAFNIPSYDAEDKKWHVVRTTWRERLDCFWGGVETAIIGYVYCGVSEK